MSYDQITLYNPIESGQNRSRPHHLLDILAMHDDFVSVSLDYIEESDVAMVALFFQIPYCISIDPKYIDFFSKSIGVNIRFDFTLLKIFSNVGGKLTISKSDVALANATQVVAYVPLWRKWLFYYPSYQSCFGGLKMTDKIVISAETYWASGALRATGFEFELFKRVEYEVKTALRRILKSYSTLTKNNCTTDDTLYSLFLLLNPGRLVYNSIPVPLISHFIQSRESRFPQAESTSIHARKIADGISFTYRKFSRYELKVFELNKLIDNGNNSLALIGSVSLIEWLIKVISPKHLKSKSLNELSKRLISSTDGSHVIDELHRIRQLRNSATQQREFSDFYKYNLHEILDSDVNDCIDSGEARKSVDLAWEFFQLANRGELSIV
jgi:hypothetical protein